MRNKGLLRYNETEPAERHEAQTPCCTQLRDKQRFPLTLCAIVARESAGATSVSTTLCLSVVVTCQASKCLGCRVAGVHSLSSLLDDLAGEMLLHTLRLVHACLLALLTGPLRFHCRLREDGQQTTCSPAHPQGGLGEDGEVFFAWLNTLSSKWPRAVTPLHTV